MDELIELAGALWCNDNQKRAAMLISAMIDRRIAAAMTRPEPTAPGVVAVAAAAERDANAFGLKDAARALTDDEFMAAHNAGYEAALRGVHLLATGKADIAEHQQSPKLTAAATALRDALGQTSETRRVQELLDANNRLLERARRAEGRAADMEATLRSFMCFLHGLCCPGCSSQGRALADHCCKDADCDAGFYGVDADAIRDLLNAGEALMPGILAEIESPADPINEVSIDDQTKEGGAA